MSEITLHEEIQAILMANDNKGMSYREIADEVNRRGIYRKRNGTNMQADQIRARINKKKYSHLFEKKQEDTGVMVTLPATTVT